MSRRSPTAETRAKISASLMGHPISDETRAKWSAQRSGVKHGPPSAETRAKISAALVGKPNRGRSHPNSIAALIAHRRTGAVLSPEQRAAMSLAMMGNTHIRDATIKGECVYCFGPAETHDHVIPKGRPGWDDPDNLVLACFPCNRAKNNRTPEEWFATGKARHDAIARSSAASPASMVSVVARDNQDSFPKE